MLKLVYVVRNRNHTLIMDEIYEYEKKIFLEKKVNEFKEPNIKYFLDYTVFDDALLKVISDLIEESKNKNVYIVLGSVISSLVITKFIKNRLGNKFNDVEIFEVVKKPYDSIEDEDIELDNHVLIKGGHEDDLEDKLFLESLYVGLVSNNYSDKTLGRLKEYAEILSFSLNKEGKEE